QDPPESSDRLIINPVDIPGIRTATVGALIAAMPPAERPDVWIPSVGGRRGHPVILGPRAIDAVRHLPSGQTLRDVWNDPNLSLEHVSIDDPWCRFDVDTPEDYDRIRNEHGGGE
ncbi:MAG: NTP transferase domain-containing protein, partial [Planctomycetota bacterium]